MGASNKTFDSTLVPDANAHIQKKYLSGTVSAGAWVMQDAAGKVTSAAANTQANANVFGILANGNGVGQLANVITEGRITGLTGLTKGQWYCISDDLAGSAMLPADLGTGDWSTLLGYALSTTEFYVKIIVSNLQV